MKKFKSCVITQSVVVALILCIIVTVLGRFCIVGLICGTSMDMKTMPLVYLLIMSIIYAVCIVVSVIFAQSSASKKGCIDVADNPTAFYLILMAIFAAISVVVSLVCIRFNTDAFMGNVDITVVLSEYSVKYPELSGRDIVDKVADEIRSGVIKGSIIGNIVQAVVTFAAIPICLKRHNTLF